MWMTFSICDYCEEPYNDCEDSSHTECENYHICETCSNELDLHNEDKLNEEGLLKKEFYEVKKKTIDYIIFK